MDGEKRLIAYVRDNTEHKKSLKEKETLLAEVHHRVKNNLAIISGLLQMQVFNTDDKKLLEKLKVSQSRIQSIAMVHEKLYGSESFSEIAIYTYINDLLEMIENSMTDFQKEIKIEKEMDSIQLTVSQAIPCGLLLNEMLTNCYKHAFNEQDEGTVKISIKKQGTDMVLKVEDDGVGLPDDFSMEEQSSLGMTIINTLANQLNGHLDVQSDSSGTQFKLAFVVDNDF
jgi:two-component sensor histidine kinase